MVDFAVQFYNSRNCLFEYEIDQTIKIIRDQNTNVAGAKSVCMSDPSPDSRQLVIFP